MPIAVKGAGVFAAIADWRPWDEVAAIAVERAIVTQHVAVDRNVRRQHRAGGGVLRCTIRQRAIDQPGEPVELLFRADLIRVFLCASPIQRPRRRRMRQQHGAAEQGQDEQALNHSSFYHHCFLLLCHRVSSLPFAVGQGLPPFPGARGSRRRGAAGPGGAPWDGWPQVPSRAPGSWR